MSLVEVCPISFYSSFFLVRGSISFLTRRRISSIASAILFNCIVSIFIPFNLYPILSFSHCQAWSLQLEAFFKFHINPYALTIERIWANPFALYRPAAMQLSFVHYSWSQIHWHSIAFILISIQWIRDQLLSYTGASTLAIQLVASWQASSRVIAVDFPQLQHLIPDPTTLRAILLLIISFE